MIRDSKKSMKVEQPKEAEGQYADFLQLLLFYLPLNPHSIVFFADPDR